MTNSKNIILSYATVVLLLLLSAVAPSAADPGLIGSFIDLLFPKVHVTITNEANHTVFTMCDAKGFYQGLHALKPGENTSWEFRNIMFPLRWSYVYVNNDTFGVFWAYNVRLACTTCKWVVRDNGVYLWTPRGPWVNQPLYTEAEYF